MYFPTLTVLLRIWVDVGGRGACYYDTAGVNHRRLSGPAADRALTSLQTKSVCCLLLTKKFSAKWRSFAMCVSDNLNLYLIVLESYTRFNVNHGERFSPSLHPCNLLLSLVQALNVQQFLRVSLLLFPAHTQQTHSQPSRTIIRSHCTNR